MKRGKKTIVMLLCGGIVSVLMVASSAASLPTILFLSGEKVPVTIEGSVTGATELKASQNMAGKGFALKLEFPSGTSNLGPYTAEYKGIKEEAGAKASCNTTGDAAEVILLAGNEAHLVFDTLSPILGVAVLLLIATILISCNGGARDFKLSGSLLALVTPLNKEVLTSESFNYKQHCVAGKTTQEDTHYFNSTGVEQTAKLSVEVGGMKGNGCEEVAEEVSLKPSKMIELMG